MRQGAVDGWFPITFRQGPNQFSSLWRSLHPDNAPFTNDIPKDFCHITSWLMISVVSKYCIMESIFFGNFDHIMFIQITCRKFEGNHLQGIHGNPLSSWSTAHPQNLVHLIGPKQVWREPEPLRRRWLSNQPVATGCHRTTNGKRVTQNGCALEKGDCLASNMAMFGISSLNFWGCTTVDSYHQLHFQTLPCSSPRRFTEGLYLAAQHILRLNDLPELMADFVIFVHIPAP